MTVSGNGDYTATFDVPAGGHIISAEYSGDFHNSGSKTHVFALKAQ